MLSAEMRQPEDQLDWVDIGGDDYQLGLLLLDESGDVIESAFDHERLLLVNGLFLGLGLSLLDESVLLLLLVLRLVLLEETGESLELVLSESVGELVDDSWDLESLEEDFLLSLEKDVLWPLDISGQVSLWLDVSSNLVISWSALDQFGVGRFLELSFGNFGHRL